MVVHPASRRIPRALRYSGINWLLDLFIYGAITLSGWAFHPSSTKVSQCRVSTHNPRKHALWFGLFPVRSPLLRKSLFNFSSCGYLDVSVPRVPSCKTMDSSYGDRLFACRVSPFGCQRINACLRLPVAFRSLPRPSSAYGARASTLCSL